jgi:hypothetical protein
MRHIAAATRPWHYFLQSWQEQITIRPSNHKAQEQTGETGARLLV